MAALTVYPTGTASGATLTTADTLVTAAPGAETSHTSKTGKLTGWGVLQSQGNVNAWAAGVSEPAAADVHGFLLDDASLEGFSLAAGTYTISLKVSTSSGTVTGVLHARLWKRSSGGVFTAIADGASASTGFTSVAAIVTITVSGIETAFTTGDKLYMDVLLNITANTSASTTATTSLFQNLSTAESVITPGTVKRFAYTGTTAGQSVVSGAYSRILTHPYTGTTATQSGVSGIYSRILTHPYAGTTAVQSGVPGVYSRMLTHSYTGVTAVQSVVSASYTHTSMHSYAGTTAVSSGVSSAYNSVLSHLYTGSVAVSSGVSGAYTKTFVHPYTGNVNASSGVSAVYGAVYIHPYVGSVAATSGVAALFNDQLTFIYVGRTAVSTVVTSTYGHTSASGAVEHLYTGRTDIHAEVDSQTRYRSDQPRRGGDVRKHRIDILSTGRVGPLEYREYDGLVRIARPKVVSIYDFIPNPWTQQDEELLLISNLLAA